MDIESYITVYGQNKSELSESKSRFIAISNHARSTEECNSLLRVVRKQFYDAAHFPYAYRLGPDGAVFRYSDDGEPSGTGGKPLHEALQKHSLTDTLIVVVRYFGGIKLGTGGLRRAFFGAADNCLASTEKREMFVTENLTAEFDFRYIGSVMKLIDDFNVAIVADSSGEKCIYQLEVRKARKEDFCAKLISVTSGSIVIR